MPSDQSTEKSSLLLTLGATVDLVPPAPIVDPAHYVNRARHLATHHITSPTTRPGSRGFFANQFENPANWHSHFRTTGPEILSQTQQQSRSRSREKASSPIDAFVSGAGTGGTITGVALYLKPRCPGLRVVLADPQGSGLFNRVQYGVMFDVREREGTRRRQQTDSMVEGIGINRVTGNFEAGREMVDEAVRVSDEEAMGMARWLMEREGLFVGGSSAVNCKWSLGVWCAGCRAGLYAGEWAKRSSTKRN